MAETAGRDDQLRRRAEEAVKHLEETMLRHVRALLECIHHQAADRCGICRGRTTGGLPMETLLDIMRERGFVTAELFQVTNAAPNRRPRSLRTLIGLGIGAGAFAAIVGWRGGKILVQAIRRNPPAGTS